MPARLFVLLGAVCALLAAVSFSLLRGWIDPSRARRASLRGELEERVFDQTDRLGTLQVQSDDDREIIYRAIDALTSILNEGRAEATVSRAVEQFTEVESRVDQARRATGTLPRVTDEILTVATAAEDNARLLQDLERQRGRVRRWTLLQGAMREMIEAHGTYKTLNTRLIKGFGTYEQLYQRTREWIMKNQAGDFKTPAIAAEWYSHASDPLLSEMRLLTQDLGDLEADVAEAARRAKAAFDLVEKEVEAGRR